jgi:hypothetical protein
MDKLIELAKKESLSKSEAKKLRDLFDVETGIRYGGCMCAVAEREALQQVIINHFNL